MLSPPEQAAINLRDARALRASGLSYRKILRRLGLSPGQLGHIKRALKREKAAGTKLRKRVPGASERDLPIGQSVLPAGLRKILVEAGFRTLGDLAERLAETELPKLETLSGIGPHRARLIRNLLDDLGLLAGPEDLRAAIAAIFPDLAEERAIAD